MGEGGLHPGGLHPGEEGLHLGRVCILGWERSASRGVCIWGSLPKPPSTDIQWQPLQRSVRILLECILVFVLCPPSCGKEIEFKPLLTFLKFVKIVRFQKDVIVAKKGNF